MTTALVRKQRKARVDLVDALHLATSLALGHSRRKGIYGDDAADFGSYVRVKVLSNNCAVLQRFRADCALKTFLQAVVKNAWRDFQDRRRGRWRSSAAARRLGKLAVALEQKLVRDGMSLAETVHHLNLGEFPDLTVREAACIVAGLPTRYRRTFEGEHALTRLESRDRADDRVLELDRMRRRSEALALIRQGLDQLPRQDRTIVELHVLEGLSLAQVSRVLGIEQRPLYRRMRRILRDLRRAPAITSFDADGLFD